MFSSCDSNSEITGGGNISDYRVTLTQYPLNPTASNNTSNINTASSRHITSTALQFHSSLLPAEIVCEEQAVAKEVDPLNMVSSKVGDMIYLLCCTHSLRLLLEN
jgi:hypothetical protein